MRPCRSQKPFISLPPLGGSIYGWRPCLLRWPGCLRHFRQQLRQRIPSVVLAYATLVRHKLQACHYLNTCTYDIPQIQGTDRSFLFCKFSFSLLFFSLSLFLSPSLSLSLYSSLSLSLSLGCSCLDMIGSHGASLPLFWCAGSACHKRQFQTFHF